MPHKNSTWITSNNFHIKEKEVTHVYIALNTCRPKTFCLGVFKTFQEAQHSFFIYLEKHQNFTQWFAELQELAKYFHNITLVDIQHLEQIWFSKNQTDNETGLIESLSYHFEFTVVRVPAGTLFDFRQWDNWLLTSFDNPLENNNLYSVIDAVLYSKSFVIDYDEYLKYHPFAVDIESIQQMIEDSPSGEGDRPTLHRGYMERHLH